MVTAISVALLMIDAGTFSTKLTSRLAISTDRNWYINTTPLVAVSCNGISRAISRTVLVIGATIENPVWSLKDCLDITKAGRRLIIYLPALGSKYSSTISPLSGTYLAIRFLDHVV